MSSTTYSWPDWMPRPLKEGFSMQPEERRTISDTEAGQTVRVEFDTDQQVAECSLILNRYEAAWFEAFERDLLRQGSTWFYFPVWEGGEVVEELCRFKDRPTAGGLIGLHTTYTFSLYVQARTNLLGECWLKLLMCYGPPFWCDFYDVLKQALSILSNVTVAGVMDALAYEPEE